MLFLTLTRVIVNVLMAFMIQISDVSRLRTSNATLGLILKMLDISLLNFSSNAISDEILRRIEAHSDLIPAKILDKLKNLLGDHSESLKNRSCNPAKKACGRTSKAANYLYYEGLYHILYHSWFIIIATQKRTI